MPVVGKKLILGERELILVGLVKGGEGEFRRERGEKAFFECIEQHDVGDVEFFHEVPEKHGVEVFG